MITTDLVISKLGPKGKISPASVNDVFRHTDKKGKLHCDDGPALQYKNGTTSWWKHGQPHRIDGPAAIDINGNTEWWINGVPFHNKMEYQRKANLSDEDMLAIIIKYGEIQ